MNTPPPLALYNPALLPPDTLLAEFTARRPLLERLLAIVRENKPGQPPQHALLIGPRGMGKTTTLWAIAHSVARDAELSRQWQPVVFDEESRRVGDLADFWLEAIRQWEYAAGENAHRADALLDAPGPQVEEWARDAFLKAVDASGRRALLLVDNLNELFGSIHDPAPLHRLRAFLMQDARVTIIGTATRYFEDVTSIDKPFFDFFRSFELKPLTLDEMKTCLLALASSRNDKSVAETLRNREGTVQALHLLTGGNPRLVKTFYKLLAEGLRGDIRADLERLLDEFTPYFKAILDALPGQQQRILDALALAWDPVEVSSLARTTRLPSNQVSAQLRSMVRSGLLAEAGQPKRKTYLLADRFSNIHYLMRHGRAAHLRFDGYINLVRLLFPDETQRRLSQVASQSANYTSKAKRNVRELRTGAFTHAKPYGDHRQLSEATFHESPDYEIGSALAESYSGNTTHITPHDAEAWRTELPGLAAKCAANPKNENLFDFTVEGFLQLARLTKPAESLAVIEALADPTPFETLAVAFRAHGDREHMERLAPERRAVALRLLERLPTSKKSG